MTTSSVLLIQKAMQFGSKPDSTSFPELPTVTTWLRLLIGALYGVSLGIRNENSGLVGMTLGLNVIAFVPILWLNGYLQANIDSYKNLRFVGVVNGLAIMLLIWIVFFTNNHEQEEKSLQKIISDAIFSAETDKLETSTTEETTAGTDEF
ncbi:hypothetical protein ACHAWC_001725 [Mediolabrus comicus]